MSVNIELLMQQLAEHGQAPREGCALFGVGYEPHFERLRSTMLRKRFKDGGSAEKFVIGPYGSGKTHFLRQLSEMAREEDCVTIEIALNRRFDITKGNVIYSEMAQAIRLPEGSLTGIDGLLRAAVDRVRQRAETQNLDPEVLVRHWAGGIPSSGLVLPAFGRVAGLAVNALLEGDQTTYGAAVAWLSGNFGDKAVARSLNEPTCDSAELRVRAHNAKLSLYQFVRICGFAGTVVGFDEAEQGINVDKKHMAKIFSELLSELNAMMDLERGSAVVVYAVTPDVIEKITRDMPMLRQRLADPAPGLGFFDGNVLAPRIDLTLRNDPYADLAQIAGRLTLLFFDRYPGADGARRDEALGAIPGIVNGVLEVEASSSARRELVKRVAATLLTRYTESPGWEPGPVAQAPEF